MKLGFGLLSLLIGVAIVLYLQAQSATQVNKTRKQVVPQVEQMSGEGFATSYAVEAVETGGKVRGLKITRLNPAGPMATYFPGIKVGDEVVEVGPLSVKDSEVELMTAMLMEAGTRSSTLKINRNGQMIEIPCTGPVDVRNGKSSAGGIALPGMKP